MERLKEVISVTLAKGGTGKTMTVNSLAEAFLRIHPNLRILVIDLDSQCSTSALLGWKDSNKGKTVYDSLRDQSSIPVYSTNIESISSKGGIFLTPGHKYLSSVEIELNHHMQPKAVLRRCFSKPIEDSSGVGLPPEITDAFDYIFIDCPPAINDIIFNAMSVSDSIIIPVQSERLACDSLTKTLNAYEIFKEEMKPDLNLRGILLTMQDERTNANKEITSYIRATYRRNVFWTRIRRCIKVVEAQALGQPLFKYAPHCTTALDYYNLAREILSK